jgi:catechol 2,3-dioxygenase-like lactoylglutathione lyase family enzyme
MITRGFEPLGLDHVVLHVRDQAESRRFYQDVLGCTLDHVNERISLVQLRFGEHLIDLLPGERAKGGGLDHFCLSIRCADLARVRDDLRARGVAVDGDVVERRGAFGSGPSLYIQDPDGYRIELKPR